MVIHLIILVSFNLEIYNSSAKQYYLNFRNICYFRQHFIAYVIPFLGGRFRGGGGGEITF